jgi:GNAT superfamily N-acetyltransferase
MDSFQIRQAVEADIPLILRFIRQLAAYENLSDQVIATEDTLRGWMFRQNKAEALIGELNGVPVGFALYFYNFSTFLGRSGIYIEDLYLIPEVRGRGYGKAIFRHLCKFCLERGCGRLEWACLDWNRPSIDFYLSLGACPMRDWTVYRLSESAMTAFLEK